MRQTITFTMDRSNLDRCEELVESGEFENVSDVITYSMRLFSEELRSMDVPDGPHIKRGVKVPRSVRIETSVMDVIEKTDLYERGLIPDVCLKSYFKRREGFKR